MSPQRTILHADLDAFYASVEQRDNPAYRGLPIIIGGYGKRDVVSTASYEAREFGVHSAQPGIIAKRLCPQGIFVRPRMKAYIAASKKVFEIFQSFTPMVEGLSLDEAFLDITKSLRLFGSARNIADQLRERVLEDVGLTISVGIASSKYVAKVASDLEKPDGLVAVRPGRERQFLAPLPLKCMWGAGPKTREKLESLGLVTIGDLHRLQEADLIKILGKKSGSHFYHLSRGIDARSIVTQRDAKSISRERTFAEDIADDEVLRHVLLKLCEDVGRRLRLSGVMGSVVRLKLRKPDFTTKVRQTQLPRPSASDMEIYREASQLLNDLKDENDPIRLIGVGVSSLGETERETQLSLFGLAHDKRDMSILETMDRIREKFGARSIGHGASQESGDEQREIDA